MAKNKKSFLLYVDLIHTVEALTDKEAGKLIKHIFRYVNDKNPEPPDRLTKLTFEPIKQQLKRDLKEWEDEKKNRSKAGKKGMQKRWGKNNKAKQGITGDNKDNAVINPITPITDNVTVNVNDTVNVNENVINTNTGESGFYADTLDKEMSLTEHQVGTTIEFLKYKSGYEVSNYQVQTQWKAFKIQVFPQHKWYKNLEDLVRHFRESLKFDIRQNGTHKQTATKNHGKSAAVISIAADLAKEAGLNTD